VTFILWFCLAYLAYIYIGYPLLLYSISLFVHPHHALSPTSSANYLPSVSLIITAHNEEEIIVEKIRNSFSLDYPTDKLEILVVSDGSTDSTVTLVKSFSDKGVRVLDIKERVGKTEAQNRAVESAEGEIIVFSDANAMYEKDTVTILVRNFEDSSIGCVCGRLKYHPPLDAHGTQHEHLYWSYETWLKRAEVRIGGIIIGNGSIYAIRACDFVPLPAYTSSDFLEPLVVKAKGHRITYDWDAVSTETLVRLSPGQEYQRRHRTILLGFSSLLTNRSFLNPLRHPVMAVQLFSHKVLRWLSPFVLLLFLLATTIIAPQSLFWSVVLGAQIVCYLTALLGLVLLQKNLAIGKLGLPAYFCITQAAALTATIDVLRGKKIYSWTPRLGPK
jgi:glycosyltransferase involved in cell wall biosynthesis